MVFKIGCIRSAMGQATLEERMQLKNPSIPLAAQLRRRSCVAPPPWRIRTFTSCWNASHALHGSTAIMAGRQTEQRHRQGRHVSCAAAPLLRCPQGMRNSCAMTRFWRLLGALRIAELEPSREELKVELGLASSRALASRGKSEQNSTWARRSWGHAAVHDVIQRLGVISTRPRIAAPSPSSPAPGKNDLHAQNTSGTCEA